MCIEAKYSSKILSVIDGKSGRIRETYFSKNHTDIYNDIVIFCSDISDLPFVQKLWHYTNSNPGYVLCTCGGRVTFHKNWLEGYRKFCTSTCSLKSDATKEKRKA